MNIYELWIMNYELREMYEWFSLWDCFLTNAGGYSYALHVHIIHIFPLFRLCLRMCLCLPACLLPCVHVSFVFLIYQLYHLVQLGIWKWICNVIFEGFVLQVKDFVPTKKRWGQEWYQLIRRDFLHNRRCFSGILKGLLSCFNFRKTGYSV
jgi:hypothetical protein